MPSCIRSPVFFDAGAKFLFLVSIQRRFFKIGTFIRYQSNLEFSLQYIKMGDLKCPRNPIYTYFERFSKIEKIFSSCDTMYRSKIRKSKFCFANA